MGFDRVGITRQRQGSHSGNRRRQPNPCCAKAAEARVSRDVCRASRKRPEDGYQGSESHQASCRRLMLLFIRSISWTTHVTIPRLPMLTLANSPSSIDSRFFSPLSAGSGICGDFLCMLPSQRRLLMSKVCRCGVIVSAY